MAYVSEEFEVDGADVAAVLAWAEATASPDRTYTLYALVDCDGAAGLVRLAGIDPTATTHDEGVTAHRRHWAIHRRDGRWQDRPCRARPADRSLVAEAIAASVLRDQDRLPCSRDCSRDAPRHLG
jgi:hypothetical protein